MCLCERFCVCRNHSNVNACDFEAFFNGVSKRVGIRFIEKCFESARVNTRVNVCSFGEHEMITPTLCALEMHPSVACITLVATVGRPVSHVEG